VSIKLDAAILLLRQLLAMKLAKPDQALLDRIEALCDSELELAVEAAELAIGQEVAQRIQNEEDHQAGLVLIEEGKQRRADAEEAKLTEDVDDQEQREERHRLGVS